MQLKPVFYIYLEEGGKCHINDIGWTEEQIMFLTAKDSVQ